MINESTPLEYLKSGSHPHGTRPDSPCSSLGDAGGLRERGRAVRGSIREEHHCLHSAAAPPPPHSVQTAAAAGGAPGAFKGNTKASFLYPAISAPAPLSSFSGSILPPPSQSLSSSSNHRSLSNHQPPFHSARLSLFIGFRHSHSFSVALFSWSPCVSATHPPFWLCCEAIFCFVLADLAC